MLLRSFVLAAGLLAAQSAHAWFFFIIPTGPIQSAIQGNHCVSESAKEGDRITAHGRDWIVKSTSGVSTRCNHHPQWPVVAKLEPIWTEAELEAEHTICVAEGTAVGSRTTVPGIGDVVVKSLARRDCTDGRAPMSARVVRLQPAPIPARHFEQPLKETPTVLRARSESFKVEKTVADRLRELKQLRDENLITQEVYESKQRDILSSQ